MEKINFQNNITKANAETMNQLQDNIEKSVCPVGTIVSYAGLTAPNGWLICNGQSLSKNDYLDLFNVIEYTYGGENDNFNIPNLNGKIPVGLDTTQTEFDEIGKTGGEKKHTLTVDEMPTHNHDMYSLNNSGDGTITSGGGITQDSGAPYKTYYAKFAMENSGGGQAHNNLQPYITLNYIIKY